MFSGSLVPALGGGGASFSTAFFVSDFWQGKEDPSDNSLLLWTNSRGL